MTDRLVQLQPMHAHALESFSEFDARSEERHGYFEPREASIETVIERLNAAGLDLRRGTPATTWFWESAGVLKVINLVID